MATLEPAACLDIVPVDHCSMPSDFRMKIATPWYLHHKPKILTIAAFAGPQSSCCAPRYSTALEATGISHTPHCMPIDATELQDFCVDSGYNVRLERSGTFFTPPSFNVHLTDWERAARLRYCFFLDPGV